MQVTDCTISGNSAGTQGGGLYNRATSVVSLTNAIVAGNTGTSQAPSDIKNAGTLDGYYSLIGTGGSGGLKAGSTITITSS